MKIFVCPLDWGLGHAARCIPIIRYLLEKNIEVVVGAEGVHLIYFKQHFPQLEYIEFPGYHISYSATFPVGVMVTLQVPKIFSKAHKEHVLLSNLLEKKGFDAVISDNRYGLWNKKIPAVIISHQLNILMPEYLSHFKLIKKMLDKSVRKHINHFDECWVPDFEGNENISGILSHPVPAGINAKYVGLLSRFENNFLSKYSVQTNNLKYDLFVILSGPEPQRSKLEDLILQQLKALPAIKALIIQGLPGEKAKDSGLKNAEMLPHINDADYIEKLSQSNVILCRAGYTTLMDLLAAGWKKAIFIPTPGQTEQEYLARFMEEKGMGVAIIQSEFSLMDAMQKAKKLNPAHPIIGKEKHETVIDKWLEKIRTFAHS